MNELGVSMTAYDHPAGQTDLSWDAAPLLAFGDTPEAMKRASDTVAAGSGRAQPAQPLGEAIERLDRQARTGAVWLELDRSEPSDMVDAVLARIERDAAQGVYPAVVAVPPTMIDRAFAVLRTPDVQILVQPDAVERSAAWAIAVSKLAAPRQVNDIASDNSAARLRQLSDEVGRIAATLARISGTTEGKPMPAPVAAPSDRDAPQIAADTVRAIIRARRLRADHLPADLFADPAWDMLLDLLQAEIVQHRVPVSSLCIAAAVPATTALRWIKTMTDRGLLTRRDDPHDGRRVFIEMAPTTSLALRRYFTDAGRVSVM